MFCFNPMLAKLYVMSLGCFGVCNMLYDKLGMTDFTVSS